MQISTTARHCELDPEVRLFAEQRLHRLERYARDIREAHMVLSAEKFRYSAEITVHLNGHELVGRESSDQPRLAIDLAADRVEEQLRRLKDRRVERSHRRPGAESRTAAEGAAPGPEAWDDEG